MKGLMKLKGRKLRINKVIFLICVFILSGLSFLLCGCRSWEQPGETMAEGHIRHKRILRLNKQEMTADIDRVLQLDEPSKLTNRRIP